MRAASNFLTLPVPSARAYCTERSVDCAKLVELLVFKPDPSAPAAGLIASIYDLTIRVSDKGEITMILKLYGDTPKNFVHADALTQVYAYILCRYW